MYNMGASCLGQGKVEAAIKHIRDSMKVTKFHEKNMPAEIILKRRDAHITDFGADDVYDRLISISWR